MLTIEIPPISAYDEAAQEFIETDKPKTLSFEHSLISISKWETKWHKPFLSTEDKTPEETFDYIRCMCITPNVDSRLFGLFPKATYDAINSYIADPATATTITYDKNASKSREIITSELIYFWMVSYRIPFDPCEKWPFNRLWKLIEICSEKNKPPKMIKGADLARQNSSLNKARRKRLGTRG